MPESSSPERIHSSNISRRGFLIAAGTAGLGLGAFAATHERHALEIERIQIKIRELPDAFVGFRIVQFSDIHLEEYTEQWFLESVVEKINSLQADLVLFTGDLISAGPASWQFAYNAAGIGAEILSKIKAPQRFAIPGNHDTVVGVEHITAPLQSHGFPVLMDRFVPIERRGDRVWLCGTTDITWNFPDLYKAIPGDPRAPVILMAHEPDYVDYLVKHPQGQKVDLMLSGHTHGGQVRIPGIGPINLPTLGRRYVRGHFHFGNTQLYVNRGIGTVGLPLRLDCPPELTEITLART